MKAIVPEKLVAELLRIGELMMNCGAEVFRVEDTLKRIGYAYGAVNMNVFAITSSIIITMELKDGRQITQTRRISSDASTDLMRLERLNALSREICAFPVPTEILEQRVEHIIQKPINRWKILLGYVMAASAFSVFFGGTIADFIFAAFVGAFVWAMHVYIAPVCMNIVISQGVITFLTGLAVTICSRVVPGVRQEPLMMGVIMLLVPGVAFTNSLRDILLGDTLSGILRMIEALILAGILAVGVITAIWLATRLSI